MFDKKNGVMALTLMLAACGGGGGGGTTNGGTGNGSLVATSGSVSETDTMPDMFGFAVAEGHAYSVSVRSTSGDADLIVANARADSASPSIIDMSWNYADDSASDVVSFVSGYAGSAYGWVFTFTGTAAYEIQATSNHLTVGGGALTATAYSTDVYYSFDVEQGKAYRVTLTPSAGDADLAVYSGASPSSLSSALTPSGSVGTSTNTGADSVTFIASASGIFYAAAEVDYGTESTYSISVAETGTEPDLAVDIDSVEPNLGSVTVSYTVTNNGLSPAGAFQVHFIGNSAAPPAASATGQAVAVGGLAAGAVINGQVTVATGAAGGNAYAIVDPEGAITEADETNNVSAGAPWTAPIEAPATFDFEDGSMPGDFTSSGNAAWTVDGTTTAGGSQYGLRAGVISHSQTSCFEMTVGAAAQLSFDWKTSSEQYYDYLKLYVDGTSVRSISGDVAWTTVTLATELGVHNYRWCYEKSYASSYGMDTAWVDNIQFTPAPPELSVTLSNVTSTGTAVSIDYTVSNAGGDAGASTLQLWANQAAAPVPGATGDQQVAIAAIPSGGSVSGTAVVSYSGAAGTAYGIIDSPNTVAESDETNNVSAGAQWLGGTPLVQYTFEDNQVPVGFTASGNTGWVISTTHAASGSYSLASGNITHSESSCTAVTVANSSAARFDWSVSSESGWDYLRFYIDDVQQSAIAGDRAWASEVHTFAVGSHTFKWCYSKDSSADSGLDTGWIDNIAIY